MTETRIFETDRRIRLGIWGLGRGMSFYRTCAALNIDVVAGCDFNEHMRQAFARDVPGALVTADQEEFLNSDCDAILLATFCPAHADDAIACLRAGKHVLSEVTSFHTMDEGVRLVEEVERSGLVYNMAENYPFSPANMYLARKWQEGLFGDLMYGEYEYVHEVRMLAYTYIDGVPVQPGWGAHNWRSWINLHYYNTHSLGPMMIITGQRPVRITSLPESNRVAGFPLRPPEGQSMSPSLINMDNGSVVRNLMGAGPNDSVIGRLWGTRGAAEIVNGQLRLRLGGGGGSPLIAVEPSLDELSQRAASTGHGGGDFWVLYYFARQILTEHTAPFEIYAACDCTIPGILGYRSASENGRPYDIPDFRDCEAREMWRGDSFACPRLDTDAGLWPASLDRSQLVEFTSVMKSLISSAHRYRAWADWSAVADDVVDRQRVVDVADELIAHWQQLVEAVAAARRLIDVCPECEGARVLGEMLELTDGRDPDGDLLDAVRADRERLAVASR